MPAPTDVYKPSKHERALTPRSAWRQALLDAAQKDIDACECHTDFVLAIAAHSKAWLAEVNQWNSAPDSDQDLEVWNTFRITGPEIRLQSWQDSHRGWLPKYVFNIQSNIAPGDYSMVGLVSILPWTKVSTKPYLTKTSSQIVHIHAPLNASGGRNQASAHHQSAITMAYVDRLLNVGYPGKFESVSTLERRACFVQTVNATFAPVNPDLRETWLSGRLETARLAVQSANSIALLAREVDAHMATWYAAAHSWTNGPPTAKDEAAMMAYCPPLKWSYSEWAQDDDLGLKGSGGPQLLVSLDYDEKMDTVLAARVLRKIPMGIFLEKQMDSFKPRYGGFTCSVLGLRMSVVASPAYCELGRALVAYNRTMRDMGLGSDYKFERYEALVVANGTVEEIAGNFNGLSF